MSRLSKLVCASMLCAISLIGGCASDPGEAPDYSGHVGLVPSVDPTPPAEPDPFLGLENLDERLDVGGVFYEGGSSETVAINNVTTNYFIFATDQNRPLETLTYTQGISTDRLEGRGSAEITLVGEPFWGGGIIWEEPFDLSEWTTLFVGFKSSDPSFENFELTLQSGEGDPPAGTVLDPTTYGYTNDGEWHFLEIPLQDAIDAGFDPTMVRSPFIVGAGGGTAGDQLLIDNLYFTKD